MREKSPATLLVAVVIVVSAYFVLGIALTMAVLVIHGVPLAIIPGFVLPVLRRSCKASYEGRPLDVGRVRRQPQDGARSTVFPQISSR